jgi:hypothetical protein
VEEDGGWGAAGPVCGGSEPERARDDYAVRGVRDLASDGISVAGAVSGWRGGWGCRVDPPSAIESSAHGGGDRAADHGVAARTARLGRAQAVGAAGARRRSCSVGDGAPGVVAAGPGAD